MEADRKKAEQISENSRDSIAKVENEQLMAAAQLAEKTKQDSIIAAKKAEVKSTEKVTIDSQKAVTPEEAELLFLQLRKKQLEQRIAQLTGRTYSSPKKETRVESEKVVEAPVVLGNRDVLEKGIVLRVQIVSSATPLDKDSRQFKNQVVYEYQQGGLYKYTVGGTADFEEITKLQDDLRDLGFKGAFVVAFKDGERLKVSEAREQLNR